MDETKPTKTVLVTDIPMSDFELIEREAERQKRPVTFLLRNAASQLARRIEAREQRKAADAEKQPADATAQAA